MSHANTMAAAARLACGHDLTFTERNVLLRIVQSANGQNLRAAVRVPVQELAQQLGRCEKTVHRALKALVEKGWITRDQIQSRRFGMQVADTWLTPEAIEALELDRVGHEMSDAFKTLAVSKERQPEPGQLEVEQPEQPDTRPVQEDVKPLLACGLKPGQIFALMGAASRAGHRLGHIVKAAWPNIAAAKSVYGYLLKLIGQQRDWSTFRCAALRKQEAEAAVQAEVQAVQDDRALVYQALDGGRRLINQARTRVLLLLDGLVHACSVDDLARPDWRHRCAPDPRLGQMAQALRDGRLVAY